MTIGALGPQTWPSIPNSSREMVSTSSLGRPSTTMPCRSVTATATMSPFADHIEIRARATGLPRGSTMRITVEGFVNPATSPPASGEGGVEVAGAGTPPPPAPLPDLSGSTEVAFLAPTEADTAKATTQAIANVASRRSRGRLSITSDRSRASRSQMPSRLALHSNSMQWSIPQDRRTPSPASTHGDQAAFAAYRLQPT